VSEWAVGVRLGLD